MNDLSEREMDAIKTAWIHFKMIHINLDKSDALEELKQRLRRVANTGLVQCNEFLPEEWDGEEFLSINPRPDMQELLEWLEKRREESLENKRKTEDLNDTINHGAKARGYQEVIDYIKTHYQ